MLLNTRAIELGCEGQFANPYKETDGPEPWNLFGLGARNTYSTETAATHAVQVSLKASTGSDVWIGCMSSSSFRLALSFLIELAPSILGAALESPAVLRLLAFLQP